MYFGFHFTGCNLVVDWPSLNPRSLYWGRRGVDGAHGGSSGASGPSWYPGAVGGRGSGPRGRWQQGGVSAAHLWEATGQVRGGLGKVSPTDMHLHSCGLKDDLNLNMMC